MGAGGLIENEASQVVTVTILHDMLLNYLILRKKTFLGSIIKDKKFQRKKYYFGLLFILYDSSRIMRNNCKLNNFQTSLCFLRNPFICKNTKRVNLSYSVEVTKFI